MDNRHPRRPNHYRKRPSTRSYGNTYQTTNPSTASSSRPQTPRRQITPPIVSSIPRQPVVSSTPQQPTSAPPRQPTVSSTPRQPTSSIPRTPRSPFISSTRYSTPRQNQPNYSTPRQPITTPRRPPHRPHHNPRQTTTNPAREFAETPSKVPSNFQPAFPSSPPSQIAQPENSPGFQPAFPSSSPVQGVREGTWRESWLVEGPPSEALSLSPSAGVGGEGAGHDQTMGEKTGQQEEEEELQPIPSTGHIYCDHRRASTRVSQFKQEFLEKYRETGIWGQWKGI